MDNHKIDMLKDPLAEFRKAILESGSWQREQWERAETLRDAVQPPLPLKEDQVGVQWYYVKGRSIMMAVMTGGLKPKDIPGMTGGSWTVEDNVPLEVLREYPYWNERP